MKPAAIPLAVAFKVAGGVAFAQSPGDPIAHLRACSLLERAERLECLDKLSRSIAPPARPAPGDHWIVSETTSPVDYTPIVIPTTSSRRDPASSSSQLSLPCPGLPTELVGTRPDISHN